MSEKSLSEKAVLVRLTIKSVGSTKKDSELTAKTAADMNGYEDAYSVSKRIFGDHIKPVRTAASDLRTTFRSLTMPWSGEDRICPLIDPNNSKRLYYKEFEDKLRDKISAYDSAVRNFLAIAPQAIEEDKGRLGAGWKSEDYPTMEELAGKFGVAFEVNTIPSDDWRTGISDELTQSIREKTEKQNEAHLGQLSIKVLANVRDLVDILLDKIQDDTGIVKADTIKKIGDTMDTLKIFPVTAETRIVVDSINDAIRKFSASSINYNPAVRETMKSTLGTVKDGLDGIVGKVKSKKGKSKAEAVDGPAAAVIEEVAAEELEAELNEVDMPPDDDTDYESELAAIDAQLNGI